MVKCLPVWLKVTLIWVIGTSLIVIPLMWVLGFWAGLICTLIVLALSWVVWGREVEAPYLKMRDSVWNDEEEDNA
jgi:hypothetical protein